MFRGALLWLIGIPIPVIIVLWLLGFLSWLLKLRFASRTAIR